jgi:hypothetical protein
MLCSALPGNVMIARLKRNMKIEAEAIVRAVNAHEAVRELIGQAIDALKRGNPNAFEPDDCIESLEVAAAVATRHLKRALRKGE